jgi:hypothetical protein
LGLGGEDTCGRIRPETEGRKRRAVGRWVNREASGKHGENMTPSEEVIMDRGGDRKDEVRVTVKRVVKKLDWCSKGF